MNPEFSKPVQPLSPHGTDAGPALSHGASLSPLSDLAPPKKGRELLAPPPREIEIRYLVPPELLQSIVGSNAPKMIVQYYFPLSCVKDLLKRFSVRALVAGADMFTTARVRSTRRVDGDLSYEIEFKGPKESVAGLRISRAELGLTISEKEFEELRALATDGMLRKRRYELDGCIVFEKANIPAIAQVDVIEVAGKPPRRLDQRYVTVDVELRDERLVESFWKGRHTFSFLSKCVDMETNGKKIRRHLSSTQIARHGLGEKQKAALDKFREIARGMS